MYVSVAIDLALDRLFTYEVPVELLGRVCVGQLLRVPFHGRITRGFALALTETPPAFATKPVMAIEDESPFFSPALLKLVKWIASVRPQALRASEGVAVRGADWFRRRAHEASGGVAG